MSLQPQLSVRDVIAHITDDVAKAICERQGEASSEQATRIRVATAAMENLAPQNAAEAMLAGLCVMFHAVMTDSVGITLRGELDTMRRATRSNIVAMNKSFHMNLDRLDCLTKPAEERATEEATSETAVPITRNPSEAPEPSDTSSMEAPAPEAASPPPPPAAPRSPVPVGAAQPRHSPPPIGAAQPRHPRPRDLPALPAQRLADGNCATPRLPAAMPVPPASASVSSPA